MLAADSKVVPAPSADSLNPEPAGSWRQIIDPVEPFLEAVTRRLAQQVEAFDPALSSYADYALNGQGKHLRPALVALSASALGGASDDHVTVAVIIETVHLATLVHDDVMDEAEIRRGRLTLAANWGNDIAVLFGDCLFAHALKLAASFPTPAICRAVAGATQTVCSGEILQTQRRGDLRLTIPEYFKILEMKTGELFALSGELSACLCDAPLPVRAGLREFGLALGTAYQVYDDCVDLFGSEATARKSLGTDLATGKLTLPVLLLRDSAERADRERLVKLLEERPQGGLRQLAPLLAQYGTLAASAEVIHQYLAKAQFALAPLPDSDGRQRLADLCQFLARQTEALRPAPDAGL